MNILYKLRRVILKTLAFLCPKDTFECEKNITTRE